MTPVMLVIVIVEITCQEDQDRRVGRGGSSEEGFAPLTGGDRVVGVGVREIGDWWQRRGG